MYEKCLNFIGGIKGHTLPERISPEWSVAPRTTRSLGNIKRSELQRNPTQAVHEELKLLQQQEEEEEEERSQTEIPKQAEALRRSTFGAMHEVQTSLTFIHHLFTRAAAQIPKSTAADFPVATLEPHFRLQG